VSFCIRVLNLHTLVLDGANSAGGAPSDAEGRDKNHPNLNHMQTPQGDKILFTIAQRKAFGDLLNAKGSMRERALERYREAEQELEEQEKLRLAKENGALDIVPRLRKARGLVKELESQLDAKGFRLDDDGDLEIPWKHEELSHRVEKAVREKISTPAQIHAKFDAAIAAVWAAPTLAEAKKTVDSLLTLTTKVER
jgi:hypothetical protein